MKRGVKFFGALILLAALLPLEYATPVLAGPDTPTNTGEIGSLNNPVPIGKPVTLTDQSAELFKVGVSEVVRGNEAWQRVQHANSSNHPPAAGKEYLMTFVVVRNLNGTTGKGLDLFDFKVYSAEQVLDTTLLVSDVRPDFRVESSPDMPGGGWIVREVYVDDPAPLLRIALKSTTDHAPDHVLYFATTPTTQ